MFINIEDKQPEGIEGFCYTEHTDDNVPGKIAKVTLPDADNIFSIMSPRYDEDSGREYDTSFIYIQDIDKLIECLQALKKHLRMF